MTTTQRAARSRLRAALPLLASVVLAGPALAADDDVAAVGKTRFMDFCAVCHGPDAKGGGPFAPMLNTSPPDLTMLASKNDGEFPFNAVYDMIDGRGMPGAHGTDEMPIWGGEWKRTDALGAETALRGRILEIIIYLRSIQQ
ncbi:MAG: c-type cytochrome [Gammaproteobacteria bacterium]